MVNMPKVDEIIDLTSETSGDEIELIKKAYSFAERAHEGQMRIGGAPYFTHVFETAKTLAQLGMDTETIVAGLLHDVVEDTAVTEEELVAEFGPGVATLVAGVTKLGTLKYKGHERYAENLRKFFVAMANDLRVVIIKFADRLHNLKTLEFLREDKRKRIALESIEVYAPLANRLGMAKIKGDLEDAAFPHAYPKEYTQMEGILKENKEQYEKYIIEIKKRLEQELEKNKVRTVHMSHRVKRKYSLWRKLLKRDMDIKKVYDIVALRVVVETVEECYRVLGIIHSIWSPVPGRIKDYISQPKPDGYRSLHTTIFTHSDRMSEIQIRTKEMHAEAANGILVRFTYREKENKKVNLSEKLKFKWIEELKRLDYSPNEPKSFLENLKMDFFNDRIFVFTPEGDVVDLPEGSCPIDFAYAIHSDIGDHISGAKINGKMSNIFSKLQNRDIVEIIKKNNAYPSGKWLKYVKTTIAKKHIRSYLDKNSLLSRLKSLRRN